MCIGRIISHTEICWHLVIFICKLGLQQELLADDVLSGNCKFYHEQQKLLVCYWGSEEEHIALQQNAVENINWKSVKVTSSKYT